MDTITKHIATPAEAVEFIQNALVGGELNMKTATEALGWSFPRIRSKAKTIAKKLNGVMIKKSRGIYFLETNGTSSIEAVAEVSEEKADEENEQ